MANLDRTLIATLEFDAQLKEGSRRKARQGRTRPQPDCFASASHLQGAM